MKNKAMPCFGKHELGLDSVTLCVAACVNFVVRGSRFGQFHVFLREYSQVRLNPWKRK